MKWIHDQYVEITIKGRKQCFSPQLIAQLPNQSVVDYINECFNFPASN